MSQILSRTLLHQGFLQVEKYVVEHEGREITNQVLNRGDSVACLLVNPDTMMCILILQFRVPVFLTDNHGMIYEVPAGRVEEDEDQMQAMQRELLEEVGFEIRDLKFQFALYNSPGGSTETTHCFLAEYSPGDRVAEGGGLAEEGEAIRVVEIPLRTAYEMATGTGEIESMTAAVLIQAAMIEYVWGD